MSTLAETLITGKKITQLGQGGYVTRDGRVKITGIVDSTDTEPARLYLDQQLTAQEVHVLLMGLFFQYINPDSYQVNPIQSQYTQRPETEIIFQRTPVVLIQAG